MSRYELVAQGGMSEELDDDTISYDAVKDRLKRKKFRRTLIATTCVIIVLFFIAAGIAIGVVMGVTKGKHSDDTSPPASTSKSFRATAVPVVNSHLSHATSLDLATPTTTRDISKTFSTMSIHGASSHSATSYISVVTPTTAASLSPHHHATTTRKTTGVSNHIPQITTSTPIATNIITTKSTIDIVASDTTTTTHVTTTVIPVFTTVAASRPKHSSESTTDHYPTTTSTTKRIRITTFSQSASMTAQITTSPSPTVVLPLNTGNSHIFNYIDTSYDPCDNFYEYSCGRWHNGHPLASEWGTSQDLALDNYFSIARYLSRYTSSHEPVAIRKAKYMYSSCIDSDYISRNFMSQLKSFMVNKAGGWENGYFYPHQSWYINSNLYKDHYLGSSALFSFGIEPDDLNSSRSVIRVSFSFSLGSNDKAMFEAIQSQ